MCFSGVGEFSSTNRIPASAATSWNRISEAAVCVARRIESPPATTLPRTAIRADAGYHLQLRRGDFICDVSALCRQNRLPALQRGAGLGASSSCLVRPRELEQQAGIGLDSYCVL